MWGFSCVHPASGDPSPDPPLCRDQELKNVSIQLLTLVTCPQLRELPLPARVPAARACLSRTRCHICARRQTPRSQVAKHRKGPHILPSQNWAIKFTISPHAASTPPLHGMDSSKAWRPSLQLFGENTAYTQPMVLYYLFFSQKTLMCIISLNPHHFPVNCHLP